MKTFDHRIYLTALRSLIPRQASGQVFGQEFRQEVFQRNPVYRVEPDYPIADYGIVRSHRPTAGWLSAATAALFLATTPADADPARLTGVWQVTKYEVNDQAIPIRYETRFFDGSNKVTRVQNLTAVEETLATYRINRRKQLVISSDMGRESIWSYRFEGEELALFSEIGARRNTVRLRRIPAFTLGPPATCPVQTSSSPE